MENSVRVLIAEDHPLFREGMRGRLERVADITVVGEAASGEEAVELAGNLEPDVILMDIRIDRKSTRLNSSHANISYAVFCLKKKKKTNKIYYIKKKKKKKKQQ